MNFELHRPQGYASNGDKYLKDAIRRLKYILIKAKKDLTYNTLCFSDKTYEELANILVEFAEDIHNDIGIWRSYEQYNLEYFNTILPLVLAPNETKNDKELLKYRVWHLMLVLFSDFNPDIILNPTHKDLIILVDLASNFIEKQFSNMPKDSGIKRFLTQPDQYAWDVKGKLVWMGKHSYLFRNSFQNCIEEENGGKFDIAGIDNYVCEKNTCWAGLGVVDILAATLNISSEQKSNLRSWCERHLAPYKILSIKEPLIESINIVNEKPYTIRAGNFCSKFEPQQIAVGSLVPWNNEWYWSGGQYIYEEANEKLIQALKTQFLKNTQIAYRYCNSYLEDAKKSMKTHYNNFVKYHGDDFVSYPDGLTMTADLQKMYRLQYESCPKEDIVEIMDKHNLSNPWPNISFPQELIDSDNGIGMYYNPDEGMEMMTEFNDVISGLKKKGVNLDEEEGKAIKGLLFSDKISPGFVKKLTQKYGDESILSIFFLDKNKQEYYLDYLLRRYKGHYYRNRYPAISSS